ncbi:MAG TPA: efflux RND transporter periplasmic adaptor subunit [Aliidongia sp.]|uniref:efflux RND transporter periplasmic adaptor subunit n=1 Tax=Aliidongia sp. TaxID=1914230 RepID=UPI002DDD61B8|nr:efflux RND transporter periplasmic adaptor subunit [Aliidongia sp.]HEV2675093.1 efflux RND transporter periplasmic adaptor subunit [Aliidongia sp.]
MRKTWVPGLVAIILIAAGVAWFVERTPASAEGPPAAPPAVPVVSGTVKAEDVQILRTGIGSVSAFNTVTIKVRVDGQLDKVAFTEGQEVKAGDVLAQIDPRPYRAVLDQATATKARDEALLANAKRDLARDQGLIGNHFVSQQVLDTQRTLVDQDTALVASDQATIDAAKVNLAYTTITSPLDGLTGIRLVDQGNIVHATDTTGLVVITQTHPISVIFTLPENLLDAINQARANGTVLKVYAYSSDDTIQLGEGILALVDNQIDQTTGTIKLKATFQNQKNALWPGEFVTTHLLLATRKGGLTVPTQTIQRGPAGTFVWVIKPDSSVEMRPVTVGQINGETALIDKGLAAGENVIVDGQYKVKVGSKVTATPQGSQTADATPAGGPAK